MSRTRRQKLARTLSGQTPLTYQQALAWLDAHTGRGGQLPRDAEAALAAWEQHQEHGAEDPAAEPASTSGTEALVRVEDVERVLAFTIKFSNIGQCPHRILAVEHYLTDGSCAHQAPQCPTCRGAGRLTRAGEVVTCEPLAELPSGVPVCGGSGSWSGQRT